MNITLATPGLDGVIRPLAHVDGITADALRGVVDQLTEEARGLAADYPPELPNQVYVRTGRLMEGWQTALPMRSGNDTILRNLVPYSGAVQDAEAQAPIFQNRWDTTAQIVHDLQPLAQAELDRAAARIAEQLERGA